MNNKVEIKSDSGSGEIFPTSWINLIIVMVISQNFVKFWDAYESACRRRFTATENDKDYRKDIAFAMFFLWCLVN